MAPITVQITYHPDSQTLTATPSTVTLENPDDWVVWGFATNSPEPPTGSTLLILIEPPLGPFQAVRSYELRRLLAKGNTGVVRSFTYFLYLARPDQQSQLIPSVLLTIDNQCSVPNISPWVKSTYVPPTGPGELGTLEVDPETLLLHEGDIALWEIANLPNNLVAGFSFPVPSQLPPDLSTSLSQLGPFPTYFVTRADGAGTVRLGGAMFASSQVGLAEYHVRVWNEAGELVAFKDPSIDGLGKPPVT